jgi:hypothetical protein
MLYLINLQREAQLRKERQRHAAAGSSPTTPVKKTGKALPVTRDSNGKSPGDVEDDDDAPEHLLLDPALMLPFSLPTSTDMLVTYGAGFGGVNRERERKYIPTASPEVLAKLDLSNNGGRLGSTYDSRDWENEEL